MLVTYEAENDAAYIYLTMEELAPGLRTYECRVPRGIDAGPVLMDWKDGKIVGIEVLSASKLLHPDLLRDAVPPGSPPEP